MEKRKFFEKKGYLKFRKIINKKKINPQLREKGIGKYEKEKEEEKGEE